MIQQGIDGDQSNSIDDGLTLKKKNSNNGMTPKYQKYLDRIRYDIEPVDLSGGQTAFKFI